MTPFLQSRLTALRERAKQLIEKTGCPGAYCQEGPPNEDHETYSLCCGDPSSIEDQGHRCYGMVVARDLDEAAKVASEIGEAFLIVNELAAWPGEAPQEPVWGRIIIEQELGVGFFASFTSGDGKVEGWGYSPTPVGALANLCATLIKIAEDEAVERTKAGS